MSELQIHDRVRVIEFEHGDEADVVGEEGVVIDDDEWIYDWYVDFGEGYIELFYDYELEVVE